MEDMDIDLDIGSNPIKKFLLHKLKEIQLNNDDLESQINRRKEMLSKCLEKLATEENILEINNIWQKLFLGKWIVGIEVKNINESGTAENVDLTLQWDASGSFTYTTNCFSRFQQPLSRKDQLPNDLLTITTTMAKGKTKKCNFLENEYIRSADIKQHATIVVSFLMPEFTDRQNYQLSGILSYEYKNKQLQVIIPTIEISIQNLTNASFDLKKYDLISGDEKSYLSMLTGSEATHLIAEYESTDASLENRLEFDCLFKKINIVSKRKSAFFVDCLSEVANNTLVMLETHDDNVYDFIIYARNNSVCQLLLHYIYKCIPNVLILPMKYRNLLVEHKELKTILDQVQSTSDSTFQDKLKTFANSMEAQIYLIEKFCNKKLDQVSPDSLKKNSEEINLNTHIKDYQNFRLQLSDLEQHTDLLRNGICNLMESLNISVEEEND